MSSLMSRSVLVLNACYEPLNFTRVRRAVSLILGDKAVIEKAYDQGMVRKGFPVPSVIRLLHYRDLPYQSKVTSRNNIFLRDKNTCQYCGKVFARAKLTLDHVIPKSRGGKNTWKNLVACCHPCNRRKDDRTLEEAGLKLLRPPREVSVHTSRELMRQQGADNPQWREFLYF